MSVARKSVKVPSAASKARAEAAEAARIAAEDEAREAARLAANAASREKARARNPESRGRAMREKGIPVNAEYAVIYVLANREYGTLRALIDYRGYRGEDPKRLNNPWVIVDLAPGETRDSIFDAPNSSLGKDPVAERPSRSYPTRKALSLGFARDTLEAPEAPPEPVRAPRARKASPRKRGASVA